MAGPLPTPVVAYVAGGVALFDVYCGRRFSALACAEADCARASVVGLGLVSVVDELARGAAKCFWCLGADTCAATSSGSGGDGAGAAYVAPITVEAQPDGGRTLRLVMQV
eukprot:SAG11_NODE_2800_length_2956_cov_1.535877_3_plen_110_part_00